MTIEELLQQRVVERTHVDRAAALRMLQQARQYLDNAAATNISVNLAYHGAYLAAFEAIRAHMAAAGVRESSGPGGHFKLGQYALDQLDVEDKRRVAAFDEVRQLRNQIQYQAMSADRGDLDEAIEVATVIVEAVARDLDAM